MRLTVFSLYKEIGQGERIALSKLAVQHYELRRRPLRLAIDISIWNFQNQAASGGKNPELRTLYYRLLRLLSLFIQPLCSTVPTSHRSNVMCGLTPMLLPHPPTFEHTKDLLSLFKDDGMAHTSGKSSKIQRPRAERTLSYAHCTTTC